MRPSAGVNRRGAGALGRCRAPEQLAGPGASANDGCEAERDRVGLDAGSAGVAAGRSHWRLVADLRGGLVDPPGRNRPHSLILGRQRRVVTTGACMASRSGSLCERGRGGSLCGWRPKALIPVGPWASGADRPRPFLRRAFLAEPRQLAEENAAEFCELGWRVLERGEDRRPLGDRQGEHFRLAAVCGLKAVGEDWVVDEPSQLEYELSTSRPWRLCRGQCPYRPPRRPRRTVVERLAGARVTCRRRRDLVPGKRGFATCRHSATVQGAWPPVRRRNPLCFFPSAVPGTCRVLQADSKACPHGESPRRSDPIRPWSSFQAEELVARQALLVRSPRKRLRSVRLTESPKPGVAGSSLAAPASRATGTLAAAGVSCGRDQCRAHRSRKVIRCM